VAAGLVQLLAAALDCALFGELAQPALERRAVGVFSPKARAISRVLILPGRLADEGEVVLQGKEGL
jgi:hypothetical protein